MLLVIDEGARRNMAAGAAQRRIVRERLCEQRFAAALRFADLADQPPAGTETGIGQEIDVLDIGDDGIEDDRRRLGPGELVDDDVVDEIAQRRHAAVVAIGRKIARAAQARDPAPDRARRLSAFGLNSGPVVSKLPGRVDIFGMKNLALPAPLTWQVPQLTPACRATPPRIAGELKARLPRLTR